MKRNIAIAAAAALVFLTGCASPPQQPLTLSDKVFVQKGVRIGVAMNKLPKVDTSFPGAGCLLCLAAASVANSSLTTHTQTLPSDDLVRLKTEVAELLNKKGQTAVVISEDLNISDLPSAGKAGPNLAKKDFSALKTKYQLDKLLVIEIDAVGISRPYASYVPTGEPKGSVSGKGYVVNLADNSLEWYLPVTQQKSANGTWDEAPSFPGLSNAYFQAVEAARDSILQPLAN
jgi:hypothetical protein